MTTAQQRPTLDVVGSDTPSPGPRGDIVQSLAELARLADRAEAQDRVCALTKASLAATGRGLDLADADLSGIDLSGFDLRHSILNRASLYGTKLVGADLSGTSMVCAGIERTDFSRALLRGAYVHAMAAQASKFVGADLTGVVDGTGALFHGCDMTEAVIEDAEIAGTTFYQCTLVRARLDGADLHGALFNECSLEAASLTRCRVDDTSITRSNITSLNLYGARGHGLAIRRPSASDGLRLSGAHLTSLSLSHLSARGVVAVDLHAPGLVVEASALPGADLTGADLTRSRLDDVTLSGADLTGAVLNDASWRRVHAVELDASKATGEGMTASECDFSSALLVGFAGRYATFRNSNFRAADLTGAYLYRASFLGDPVTSACMVDTLLDGANLTQAYLAGDFTRCRFRGGWAVYARLNQAIFRDAQLEGTSLFRASAVKTDFNGASLGGQRGGLFADRAAGLAEALRDSTDLGAQDLARFVAGLTALLERDSGKST